MIPENEQGVIILFAQQAEAAGFEILRIGTEFPDAEIRQGDDVYQVEFEFVSGNFKDHGHDVRKCDIIICWENRGYDGYLQVIALSEENWNTVNITLPSEQERELEYWKHRALRAERMLKKSRERQCDRLNNDNGKLPEWLSIIPDSLDEFCGLVEDGTIELPINVTGSVLAKYIPAVGSNSTGRYWLRRIRDGEESQ